MNFGQRKRDSLDENRPKHPIARGIGIAAVALLVVALLIPLLAPYPTAPDTVSPQSLATPDSKFVKVDGLTIHYREAGSAVAPETIILMHGFGASTASWDYQLEALSADYRVIAFDRPAFGLTERPMSSTFEAADDPYSAQANVDQLFGLMDALGIEHAVVGAHSAGGAVAVLAAAQQPERVDALILSAPAVYQARTMSPAVSAILRSPQARWYGPLLVRAIVARGFDSFVTSAYADPAFATEEVLARYGAPLAVNDWDRALWELIAAPRTVSAADALPQVSAPALVLAGVSDSFVPVEDSRRVADAIEGASIVTFADTGHLPHEERPAEFAEQVLAFLGALGD